MLVITPLPFVVTFAVAFVVGAPPPAPPVENVTTSPLAYLLLEPAPAFLISTVSTKPTPVLPPAVLDSCPAITQSRYATLAVLLSPTKSVCIVIDFSFSNLFLVFFPIFWLLEAGIYF